VYIEEPMKNMTITLDEKTAAWVRVHAAKQGKSVSRLLGELLRQHMSGMREYAEAMRRFQAVKPFAADWVGGKRPTRDELYAGRTRIR
jgi:plasmid stability protein